MPDWGSKLDEAWDAATDVGREAASKVATGVIVVGQQAIRGAEATKAGAVWVGEETEAGAAWVAEQGERAAQWSYDLAKQGARQGIKAVADPAFSGISMVQDAWNATKTVASSIADNVASAVDAIKAKFGIKKPQSILEACPPATPAKDVDYDGTLIAKNCTPVTKKGEELTRDAVAKADANSVVSVSSCCRAKRAHGEASGSIVYVNGINTTKEIDCQTVRAIAEQTCKKVYGVYNATEEPKIGSFSIADAAQTSKDRRLIRQAQEGKVPKFHDGRNPAVDTLVDLIDIKNQAGEPLELWAHSQGGAVTSLALYDVDRQGRMKGQPDPLSQITVNSFGSAAPSWVDGPKYTHYVNVNDATPFLFGLGDDPAYDKGHAGKDAQVVRFSGEPDGPLREARHDTPLDKNLFPYLTKDHSIDGKENTYLRMQKEKNGGCPE